MEKALLRNDQHVIAKTCHSCNKILINVTTFVCLAKVAELTGHFECNSAISDVYKLRYSDVFMKCSENVANKITYKAVFLIFRIVNITNWHLL